MGKCEQCLRWSSGSCFPWQTWSRCSCFETGKLQELGFASGTLDFKQAASENILPQQQRGLEKLEPLHSLELLLDLKKRWVVIVSGEVSNLAAPFVVERVVPVLRAKGIEIILSEGLRELLKVLEHLVFGHRQVSINIVRIIIKIKSLNHIRIAGSI